MSKRKLSLRELLKIKQMKQPSSTLGGKVLDDDDTISKLKGVSKTEIEKADKLDDFAFCRLNYSLPQKDVVKICSYVNKKKKANLSEINENLFKYPSHSSGYHALNNTLGELKEDKIFSKNADKYLIGSNLPPLFMFIIDDSKVNKIAKELGIE